MSFNGDFVSHIIDMGPSANPVEQEYHDFWWIKFLSGETERQIKIRQLNIQSFYRNDRRQIIIYTPTASYGLEGDPIVIDQINKSLELVTP